MAMMTISKIEAAQPVSDTFCEPVRGLSQKLQLEHHQCVRLLKAVYGLVMLQEDGTTVLRLIFETWEAKKLSWNLVCGLSEMKTVSFMLCAWFTSMTSCWRAVTLHSENMSLRASTICANGEIASHECSNSVAHKLFKPSLNTLEHGVDLRSVSQIT